MVASISRSSYMYTELSLFIITILIPYFFSPSYSDPTYFLSLLSLFYLFQVTQWTQESAHSLLWNADSSLSTLHIHANSIVCQIFHPFASMQNFKSGNVLEDQMNGIQKEFKNTDIEVYMNVNFVVRASSIATNKKCL